MDIYIYECVQVNIACAFRGVIASVRVSILGVAHSLWEIISGAGYTQVSFLQPLIRGREVEESQLVAGIVLFVKTLEITNVDICLCM